VSWNSKSINQQLFMEESKENYSSNKTNLCICKGKWKLTWNFVVQGETCILLMIDEVGEKIDVIAKSTMIVLGFSIVLVMPWESYQRSYL